MTIYCLLGGIFMLLVGASLGAIAVACLRINERSGP